MIVKKSTSNQKSNHKIIYTALANWSNSTEYGATRHLILLPAMSEMNKKKSIKINCFFQHSKKLKIEHTQQTVNTLCTVQRIQKSTNSKQLKQISLHKD